MGRNIRPHLPGAVFHLTARTQAREPCLTGLEGAVQSIICSAPARSDARLIAYAIMPNHIHILAQQGRRRLADFMQPMLRRIALVVQRRYDREGHVFERRYRDALCSDPEYLRNAIIYIHLNPVRAELARSADEYPWSSHLTFCGSPHPEEQMSTLLTSENALRLFASRDSRTPAQWTRDYRTFMTWRTQMDAWILNGGDQQFHPPSRPCTEAGDASWADWHAAPAAGKGGDSRLPRADLRDIALASLSVLAPGMPLDDLRAGGAEKQVVRVRRHFILRALAAGYSGRKIAGFLCVSPSTVSSSRAAAAVKLRTP